MDNMIIIGIVFCISQSAIFSGLNLAFFSVSRMQLEVEAGHGVSAASKILALREDANFLLTTILWGNVGINVLLTLLSNSLMTGLTAFLFSTIVITFFGEIFPQAYFSRNAMRMGALFAPVLRFYQFILYPLAKPTAWMLDQWLGKEGLHYLRERDLTAMIQAHVRSEHAEVDPLEGIGAMNFLAIDDLTVSDEGEIVASQSIIQLPSKIDFPLLPDFQRNTEDAFLKQVNAAGQSWVILTDNKNNPLLALDADAFLRDALFAQDKKCDPYDYCHRPIVTTNPKEPLGELIFQLKINERDSIYHDGVIVDDVILFWAEEKRIITGADILGRLLKGVSTHKT